MRKVTSETYECAGKDRCPFIGACYAYARQLGQLSEVATGLADTKDSELVALQRITDMSEDVCPGNVTPQTVRTIRHPIRGVSILPDCLIPMEFRVEAARVLDAAHPYLMVEAERALVTTH